MRPSGYQIILLTAKRFGLRVEDLTGPRRYPSVAIPRQVAMWICTECLGLSTTQTGKLFGRDHTTVIHGRDAIYNRILTDRSCSEAIADIVHISGLGQDRAAA